MVLPQRLLYKARQEISRVDAEPTVSGGTYLVDQSPWMAPLFLPGVWHSNVTMVPSGYWPMGVQLASVPGHSRYLRPSEVVAHE